MDRTRTMVLVVRQLGLVGRRETVSIDESFDRAEG